MTKPRVYKTEAIVLKRIKLGEAGRIFTLYTTDLGKLRAVAKGVRRPRSKLGGHLELLTHSTVMLAHGKNLDTITQSQTIDSFLPLRENLWRTSCAIYAAELVDRLTAERVENRPLFQLLLDTLNWLCQVEYEEVVLRYFELHLLDLLGYRPQLERCLSCNSPLGTETNFFSTSYGGMLCPRCRESDPLARPLSVVETRVMRFLQKSDCSSAKQLKVKPELLKKLGKVMWERVEYLSEREIKSVAWLDRMRGLARSTKGNGHPLP